MGDIQFSGSDWWFLLFALIGVALWRWCVDLAFSTALARWNLVHRKGALSPHLGLGVQTTVYGPFRRKSRAFLMAYLICGEEDLIEIWDVTTFPPKRS